MIHSLPNKRVLNNLVLLTKKEYYRKRANIIEEWKNCKIELVYTKQNNFVGKVKGKEKSYSINIEEPKDPDIPTKTAVYHELSHVLWESFESKSFAILRKWAKDKAFDLFEQYHIPRHNTGFANIPYHIEQDFSKAQSTIEKYIESLYITCFNCLEDQRIESLTKDVWLATEAMFEEAKTNLGKNLSGVDMITPSNHLLAARFNRPELTTKGYIDSMKDVEETDENGAISVMKQIMDLINDGVEKNLRNPLSNMKRLLDDGKKIESNQNDYNSASKKHKHAVSEFDKESGRTSAEDLMETFRDKMGTKSRKEQMIKQSEEAKHVQYDVQKLEEKEKQKHKFRISKSRTPKTSSNEMEKTHRIVPLSEAKEGGKRQVNLILEKMNKYAVPKEPAHILTNYPRLGIPAIPNQRIATQFAKTFDKIKETRKFKISESGSEVDIEALLQAKSKGYGEFMVDEIRSKGLMILVTIDGSNSMKEGDRISQVRNLVATMFRSVENIPQVKILANVWASDMKGIVGITPVRTEEECNQINIDADVDYTETKILTPTHEALKYSAKQLAKYSGKKLLIMITDGHPEYWKDCKQFSEQVLVNLTMKEYRKAQKYCKNMMCINVSSDFGSRENLQRIFKNNYVEFPGMEQASEFVLKNFRKTVTATLRR